MTLSASRLVVVRLCALLGVLLLVACAAEKPKPTPLEPIDAKLNARTVWSTRLDGVKFPLTVQARQGLFIVAASDGSVVALDAASGQARWRGEAGTALSCLLYTSPSPRD